MCVLLLRQTTTHTHTHIDGIDDKPNKMYSILFWGGVNMDRAATLFTRTTSSHNVRLLWPLSIGLWMARQFSICHCHANWYRWTHAVEQQVIVAAWKKKVSSLNQCYVPGGRNMLGCFEWRWYTHTHTLLPFGWCIWNAPYKNARSFSINRSIRCSVHVYWPLEYKYHTRCMPYNLNYLIVCSEYSNSE